MLILSRLYWFISWALITAIAVIIVLIVLRLIANQVDLNPFGWSSITIRRLTDPVIVPVRRTLARMTVDPKYAPLVAILAAILLGWFALQLISGIANTLAGILISLGAHSIIATMGYLLYGLLGLYSLLIFIRIILSWGMVGYSNRVMRSLVNATEP
ncbi:MAG TPA: YggT family protein, partial [Pyrinomonadaceae bacterium]|nr:YggT family protein [Pyrinomonadaceae bacterium]